MRAQCEYVARSRYWISLGEYSSYLRIKVTRPIFFFWGGGYHPTLKLSGIPTFFSSQLCFYPETERKLTQIANSQKDRKIHIEVPENY